VDALEFLGLEQEAVTLHVPGVVAGVRLDLHRFGGCDEPFVPLFEVLLVVERQRGACLLDHRDRVPGGRLSLGMEMLGFAAGGAGQGEQRDEQQERRGAERHRASR
jgi:hypothetical protein